MGGPGRGDILPCTPSLTTLVFSLPWSRQDAASIQRQYQGLLVSRAEGQAGGLVGWRAGRAGSGAQRDGASCYPFSLPASCPSTEGSLVARAEPRQPVHTPAGLHAPAERPGPAAAAHPAAGLE